MNRLFIKTGCPWCEMAVEWLKEHGYEFQPVDVLKDSSAFSEMRAISGQSKAPVLELEDGRVLADFGPEELEPFLKA